MRKGIQDLTLIVQQHLGCDLFDFGGRADALRGVALSFDSLTLRQGCGARPRSCQIFTIEEVRCQQLRQDSFASISPLASRRL